MTGRQFYPWQVRSCTIHIALDVIERLNRCLADSRMNSAEEQGGILYGTIQDGIPSITNFEFFRSAHRRGVAYDLGARERTQVARLVAARMRSKNEKPIGYFRTHLRPGMFLDQDDFAVMEEAFAFPDAVALLIRSDADGRSGGFFFWEGGDIDRRRPQKSFPFDVAALTPDSYTVTPQKPVRRSLPAPPAKRVAAAMLVPAIAAVAMFHHPSAPAPSPSPEPVASVVISPAPTYVEPAEAVQPAPAPLPHQAPPAVYSEPVPVEAPAPAPPAPVAVTPAVAVAEPVPVRAEPKPEPRPDPRPERTVLVAVSMEPRMTARSGKVTDIRKVVGHVPLFGHAFRPKEEEFTPAKPKRGLAPRVPNRLAEDLSHEFPVDVRVIIDNTGAVTSAEVLNGGGTSFANLAAESASASAWRPALSGEREVASEMILHYRFRPAP